MGSAEQQPMLPDMPAIPQTKKERGPKYYTLPLETTLFSGPRGWEGSHSYDAPTQVPVVVRVITTRQVRGFGPSLQVEVESPPEMAGKKSWVAPKPGREKGFF